MIRHKKIDLIVIGCICFSLIITLCFMFLESFGIKPTYSNPAYVNKLFDQSYVHTIDIKLEDPHSFFEQAQNKEYQMVSLVIDGEEFDTVGLRVKGNNSLELIERYQLDRFSLKIEFDHYDKGYYYYGLDKFTLDCSFQDNAYLKNFIAYDMMHSMGVPAPLTSYVWVTINQQDWGLFLAVEEPEESFVQRNYGKNHGILYKPGYTDVYGENKDLALQYIDDDINSYPNLFENAQFEIKDTDKRRLIEALKILNENQDIENAVDVDEVLRYFVVQVFVVNLDSYLGPTGHNYFLYEDNGMISMLPWDYNLAFGTYSLGMPNPCNDITRYVNFPINTPYTKDVMFNRPLFHHVMQHDEYYQQYHQYFEQFITNYFENGYFQNKVKTITKLISPYVKKDPTAFCSYNDYQIAVKTFNDFCQLRSQSIRGQLEGRLPSTIAQQDESSPYIDASHLRLEDLGEIADLYE